MRRDVLVLFGARVRPSGEPSPLLRRRIEGALAAARGCDRPLFLVMGGRGDGGATEADAMARVLVARGVDPADVVRERESRDTLEQARRAASILDGLAPVGRVLVCTSPFHQARCRLLLRMLGVRAERPVMPGDRETLGLRRWLALVLREIPATLWDAALLALLMARGDGPLASGVSRPPARRPR